MKGYSDTHERGRRRYDMLMQMLPRIMETPDPAATLAGLRKAALADDTGAALNGRDPEICARCRRRRSRFQSSTLPLRASPSPGG